MLYSWVQYRLTHYLEALKKHLPSITEGGNLASVLEHCMVTRWSQLHFQFRLDSVSNLN